MAATEAVAVSSSATRVCSILLNAQHEIRTARCDTLGQLVLIAGSSRKTGQFGPSRAPLPGRLPRPNGPVELQPEQHLPPASLLAEVHQLQDRRCARCPATDPSAQSRRGARGLCCRYHCCARNTYSVRRDPGSLPHPTTVPRKLPLHPRSSSRGSTFPKLTRSWPFAASGALSAARRCSGPLSRYHPMQRAGPQLPYGVRTFTRRPRRAGWPVLPLTGRARGSL